MKTKLLQLLMDNVKRPKDNVTNSVDGDTASVYIYDVISADWGVSALSVIQSLANYANVKTLNIHINSPGGDVFEGRAIMAAISAFKGKTVACIDSLCASAATSIALACDEVQMADGAFFMIHNAMGVAFGDKAEMRATADILEKVEGAIVNDYVQKTGKDAQTVCTWMDAETWFTAQEALDAGFIDSVTTAQKPTNKWNLSAFANAPIPLPEPIPAPAPEPAPSNDGLNMSEANALRLRMLTIA